MRCCLLVSLAVAALAAGCAAPREPAAPSGPPPFEGVKRLVLARWTDDPSGRPKDPLDALKESLEARGFVVRMVDLGRRTPAELRELERLHGQLASRIYGAVPRDRLDRRRGEALGRDAGAVVAALGVDAVALYHRFDGRPPPGALHDPFAPPGGIFPPAPPVDRRPLGALSLVDRAGNAIWFDWGSPGLDVDPDAPVNPAEAIDALVAVLTGDVGEDRWR